MARKRKRASWRYLQFECGRIYSSGSNVVARLMELPPDERVMKCPKHQRLERVWEVDESG